MLFRMLLLIFWTTLCAAQTPQPICLPPLKPMSDWERFDFNGRVKAVRTFKIWFAKDQQTGRVFAQKPHLEEEASYDARGTQTYWRNTSLMPLDPNDEVVVEYECDGPTRIKEIRYRRIKDPAFKKTVYGYDDKGLKTEKAIYLADGVLESLEKYKYDEKGNVIEEIFKQHVHPQHFIPQRHGVYVTTRRTFGYDGKRNKTSEIHYRSDGSLYARWVFEYDSRNRLIKDTRRDNLGRLEDQYFYKYRHNKLVEEKHYANFCITRNNEFCKGTVKNDDGVFYYLTKTVYEYDRRGNWVRERQFSMGGQNGSQSYQPDHILFRRITYYK